MEEPKPEIIFVGSFTPAADGRVGGQLFACRTLLDNPGSQAFRWRLIDSTQRSEDIANVAVRAFYAGLRLLRLLQMLLTSRATTVLMFLPFLGFSLLEKGLMCLLAKRFGKRVVISLRSEIHPSLLDAFPRFVKRIIQHSLSRCDVTICQSQAMADDLRKLFPQLKSEIRVVPNWLDPARYRPAADVDAMRFERRPAVVMFAGLLEPAKGVCELIDAVKFLAEGGVALKLVICGSGMLRESLERRIREEDLADVVDLRGWQKSNQMLRTFAEATVFALPSHSEGMPNAMLEAMAAGLPIVATPVGAVPELIASGENGLLVPVGDPQQLAAALRQIVTTPHLAAEMGRRNLQRVARTHDIAVVWPVLEEIIRGPTMPAAS